MKSTLSKMIVGCVATMTTTVLIGGAIVHAHIDPDPLAMQINTSGTVGFTIEHGCDGSPTTSVKIQVPSEVKDVVPIDKAGWTATVTGDVVEFSGGSLAADEEDHFDISLTAPAQPGEVRFPIIQTCVQGELAWIEVEEEGAAEPEHPAPVVKITEGPPTSADLAPEEHEDDSGAPTEATLAPAATVVAASADDDSSNTGAIVAIVAVAVVVLVGGGALIARRRGGTSTSS